MPLSIDKSQLGMSAEEKLALLKKQLLEKANKESAVYPLSFGQSAMYFLYLNSPESPAYNVSFSARIVSHLKVDSLRKAFQKLVNRHAVLRTNYKLDEGVPVQVIHGYKEIDFEQVDASGYEEEMLRAEVVRVSRLPFDLENESVLRVRLFSLKPDDHILLINIHHISNDGRSVEIMLDELGVLYVSELTGESDNLPPAEKEYYDFVRQQKEFVTSEEAKKKIDYWKNELSGSRADLDLPFDKRRQPVQTFNGASEYFEIERTLAESIKEKAKEYGATVFAYLLSCYLMFLRKHTDNEELTAGIPAAGRIFPGYDNVMGYFINPLAIRAVVTDQTKFEDVLSQVKRKILLAVDNQDIPFQLIVDELLHNRDASRSPVFQTFFGLQRIQGNSPLQELIVPGNEKAEIEWAGLKLRPYHISQQEGQFDLTVEFTEGKDLFSGAFKYNTDLFEKRSVEKMTSRFLELLRQITEDPGKPVESYSLLTPEDKDELLNKWNNTSEEFNEIDLIDSLFDKAAAIYPDRIALVFEGMSMTYSQLKEKSDAAASAIVSKGFGCGDLAAVCTERSVEMVISMLAVLKAGGAYIPVDPSYPSERISYMLENSKSKLLITQRGLMHELPDTEILYAEDLGSADFTGDSSAWNKGRNVKDPAYVIYTSGSTGLPKGVVISHRSLANHMAWMKNVAEFSPDDSVLQKTPFSFDASVWEFYLPLLNGGKLVIARPDGHMDTAYMVDCVKANGVTHIQFVPSLLKLFLSEPDVPSCTSLKFVFSGGEALTGELAGSVFGRLNARLINLYGPTEATIDSAYYECIKGKVPENIPIGRPVSNMKAFVADKNMNLLPSGISGELLLGGDGIALGYLYNNELAKERFVENIFDEYAGVLYKTGDRVKFNYDGELVFLGRLDHQVKFRGYRIELSEIESVLRKSSGVKDAYADVRTDASGREVLCAYVVCRSEQCSENELKGTLRKFLPEYMIPGYFHFTDSLPYLPNGKIDRPSLPVPGPVKREGDVSAKADLPAEKILLKIWEDILGQKNISIDDNFFELGGDSIISIQIISRASREGMKITPKQIFMHQTIRELADVVTADIRKASGVKPTGNVQCTPVQKRFLESKLKNPSCFNHSLLISVNEELDMEKLTETLNIVVRHHDALRMKVSTDNEVVIPEESPEVAFAEFDLRSVNMEEAGILLAAERKRQNNLLDLTSGRLVNASYFRMPCNSGRILFNIHHFCIDGVSWRIFLDDFISIYKNLAAGNSANLPDKGASFREWCERLVNYSSSDEAISSIDIWSEMSADHQDYSGLKENQAANTFGSAITETVRLGNEYTAILLAEANRAYNTSINDLLITALAMASKEFNGNPVLYIELEGHGRDDIFGDTDFSATIGWFTSVYPVMINSYNADDTGKLITDVKESLKKYSSEGIKYGIMKYIRRDGRLQNISSNLPSMVFNYLGQFKNEISPGWEFSHDSLKLITGDDEYRPYAIEMNSMIVSSDLVMNIEYSSNLHKRDEIQKFSALYMSCLRKVLDHCRNIESTTYTASDFSDSGLNQQELDDLMANLS